LNLKQSITLQLTIANIATMDYVDTLRALVAVVDAGGFAKASRVMGASPAWVTRAVAQLEARLGVRVLARTTRVVRVTQPGARYVEDCRRILADLAEAESALQGTHARPVGRLTITAPVMFGQMHVMPIVERYLKAYPDVDLACWFVDRNVRLIEEGVDLAIRLGPLTENLLQAVPVGQVRRIVCASPAYLRRRGTPTTPADLAQHTLIYGGAIDTSAEWQFATNGVVKPMLLRPRLVSSTTEAARTAALAGIGITRMMSYQAASLVANGQLVRLLAEFEPPPLPIHVVHREGARVPPKVRTFVDMAVRSLRSNTALRAAAL
jgi:DNA-binding transcriptional LysR family regulator